MQQKNIEKRIVAFILSFFMIFSNIINVFGYEWDLEIPPIINSNDDIVINGSDNITDDTVIINSNPNTDNNLGKNNNINNNTINTNIETTEKSDTNVKLLKESFNSETGLTVKVPILPTIQPKTLKNGDKTLTLVGGDKGADASVSFKGDESGATNHALIDYITRENNDPNAVAYCISPFYAGAKENGRTTVKVDSNLTATDRQLLGIAVAGYPHNKYNVAGYNDLTEEDKYYATLIAMEHLIFQKTGEYKNKKGVKFNGDHWNTTRWFPTKSNDANAQKIINVAKEIYAKGMDNHYDETKGIATINFKDNNKNDGTMKVNRDTYKLTITLNSDIEYSHALLQFDDPKIKQWATGDTKIQFYDGVDEKGTRLNWGTHQIDGQQYEGILIQKPSRKTDTITIVLDKATADSVITSNKYTVDYTAKFFGGGMQVGYKTRNTNSTLQDYVAITTGNATARNSISWIKNSTVESSTETTTATTTTRTEKGGLKILKYNAKTNELVPGAIFKIRGISQGVYDFNVQIQASNSAEIPLPNGGKAVCKDGVIEISNINVGTYEITEITPPPNFDLALGQNSQTVQVESQQDATLYPQVRFMNNPYGSLKIKKVDAITGQPLEGAVLKVSNPLFNYEQEFTTGADGTITINNLKQGSYEIKEVKAPNGYILSNETKVAILKWGEETTITYENQPKTSLQITKIDSETGAKLNGARFKLKHTTSGTEYFTDETVDGVATTTDLVTGTYILTEIQAPNGYILDKTERTIVIENNRVNEITIKNSKKPSLKVIKRDIETKAPLQGAKFEIYRAENNTVQGLIEKVGEYFTNQQGEINLDTLDYGWYCIKEVQAPNGYLLSEDNTKFVFLEPNQTGAKTVEVIFENHKKPNLTINKVGSVGKEPLQGAKFSLFYATTQGGAVTKVGDYVTDERGKIEIPTGTLKEGWYKLQETEAPQGYEIQGTGTYEFYLKAGESKEITVENVAKNAIVIKKVDADTGEPLAGANFSISIISDGNSSGTHGTTIANVITNHNGVAVVTGLKAGGYIIEETKAPTGYVMVEQAQTVWLNKDDTSAVTVTFENRKNAGLGIKKMDSITKDPLADAIFKVTDSKGQVVGTSNGLFRTDEKGFIHIPNLTPGAYVVQEIQAPDGYVLDNTPQTVHIEYGKLHTLEFFNTPKTSILIKKYDSETREPLANATFKVTDSKGQNVGNGNGLFTTNENGTILVPNLKKGTYIVEEVKAPNGYLLNSKPQVVEVDNGKVYTLEFFNPKYDSLTIVKLDSATKQPLANALIKVTTVDDKFIGEYRTDETGTIVVTGLKAGTYKVQEIQAPNGYVLDNTVKLVHLKQGEPQKVEIFNSKKAGIQILKRDSKTAKPLQGAKFEVRKVNGELIGANYITDSNGMITINGLEQGWYTVKETVAPNGYALNSNVQNVEVKSDKYTQIVFENDKLGSIRLKKIDYVTRKPIPNVKFKITKENGENVGEFVTDKWGEINLINKLEPATYLIEEMAVPTGYALDKGVRKVKIDVGTETMVEWENYPLATLDLLKIDERTKKPISGVEFELLNAKKQSMGKFTTDKDGRIYLESKLAQGTYYIKETKAKDGYIKNDGEKMVELKWGKTTKVEFVNTPIFGQIEIHKIGSKNNQITGQLDGDNLKGAEFTIYEKATGKEVTRVVTNYNGIARTGELPYGEYIVKETKAPSYYVLNENEFEVSIKENGEVVKLEVENKSVDLKTGGEKSTVKETKAGDTIRYDFNNLQNLSTVALDDFYIHESLPSAITVQRIFTGTFNQNMKYRIVYKTNKNKEFKVLKDNLFTDRVYEIDLTKGLQQGEYITDLKYEFERVGVGFREVEKPFLYAKVNSNVKKNEQFTNILTVGGKYDMQTVKHEDKFTTTVISTTPTFNGKLPKTGY